MKLPPEWETAGTLRSPHAMRQPVLDTPASCTWSWPQARIHDHQKRLQPYSCWWTDRMACTRRYWKCAKVRRGKMEPCVRGHLEHSVGVARKRQLVYNFLNPHQGKRVSPAETDQLIKAHIIRIVGLLPRSSTKLSFISRTKTKLEMSSCSFGKLYYLTLFSNFRCLQIKWLAL